jgi:dolichol-phosphate mannosyltransferase
MAEFVSGAQPADGLPRRATSLSRAQGWVRTHIERSPRWARWARLMKFGMVGASGLVVNEVALAVIVHRGHVPTWLGPVIATQFSTVWNFALVEWWAFRGSSSSRRGWHRFAMFWVVNNVALLLRSPIIAVLTGGFGMNILWSNLISLGVLIIGRFLVADSLIWGSPTPAIDDPAAPLSEGA